ncbi:related to amidase family protein [Cephalotrichum gorgonifer]|uniref:Related to amidase family protein n=1 Tax=Cephalotrichum gorgonifer TaxID=2041049 RepID=A0AAE8SSJ6_9PEZI|nr:related to amidase family protein [Cephalotrichum gorgonifer]
MVKTLLSSTFLKVLVLFPLAALAAPASRNVAQKVQDTAGTGLVYTLGDTSYFANGAYPKATLKGRGVVQPHSKSVPHRPGAPVIDDFTPITVIVANETTVTGKYLESTIASYVAGDDVFNMDFMASLYLSAEKKATFDASAVKYLQGLGLDSLYIDSKVFGGKPAKIEKSKPVMVEGVPAKDLPSGPYTAVLSDSGLSLLSTYRLYRDEYRTFITGAYPSNKGDDSFAALEVMDSRWWNPMIPVPSRSQAWIAVTPIANATAPAIQRLVDLGAALIGKYKLAQFASGANPWDWVDEHYPFNPRGDGYLTCSASSSGGGCSVAAYEWLDNAIGSDTGSSMRRPAAVSGTYGNRPSQGMITLDKAVPLSWAQDTAGVFSRDPFQWVKFSKAWYTPELHQGPDITGLSPLVVPDNNKFPKRIQYLTDYLPLANPEAEKILQGTLSQMKALFNMTVETMNLTSTVREASIFPEKPEGVDNFKYMSSAGNNYDQYSSVIKPLKEGWAALTGGRFPPVDPAHRSSFSRQNDTQLNIDVYKQGLVLKNRTVNWFESEMLYETEESCSESMFICDIGTGGLPSYREKDLNEGDDAAFLAVTPPYAAITCANICPRFACADFTVPLGQVSYKSRVSLSEEKYPVSINLIVRRGCDFMLYNMVEKMAEAGILKTVKTGREAY